MRGSEISRLKLPTVTNSSPSCRLMDTSSLLANGTLSERTYSLPTFSTRWARPSKKRSDGWRSPYIVSAMRSSMREPTTSSSKSGTSRMGSGWNDCATSSA